MKEILKPKSKALTEKDCYEELARIIKIYCYQAVVREEIEFFRWWVKNVLTQLSEYASSPDEPEKYPAYKELRRKASEFVREPAEDPSRVMIQRTELKAALENAEKGAGFEHGHGSQERRRSRRNKQTGKGLQNAGSPAKGRLKNGSDSDTRKLHIYETVLLAFCRNGKGGICRARESGVRSDLRGMQLETDLRRNISGNGKSFELFPILCRKVGEEAGRKRLDKTSERDALGI